MRKMKFAVALGAALALGLTGCASNGGDTPGGETSSPAGPIKVGAIVTETGTPYALGPMGLSQMVQYVFDEANAEGGIDGRQIEYIVEDDANTSAGTAQAARKLIDQDQVVGLVGGGSYTSCQTNAAAYEKADVYAIESVAPSAFCFGQTNIATPSAGPFNAAAVMLQYGETELGFTKQCAIFDGSANVAAYQGGIALYEAATGSTLAFSDFAVPANTSDFTPYLLQARDAGCEAILMTGNPAGTPLVAQQMAAQGMQDIALFVDGGAFDPSVAAAVDGLGIALYSGVEFAPLDGDSADIAAFLAATEAAGLVPSIFTQGAYLVANAFVEVLKSIDGDITRDSVSRAWESVTPMQNDMLGVPLKVGSTDVVASAWIVTANDGVWQDVSGGFVTLD